MDAATRKPRIAIVGGDKRFAQFRWPAGYEIRHFEAPASDRRATQRLRDSIMSGALDRVIVLTKWMGHSAESVLKDSPVPVTRWPRGMGELAKEFTAVVGLPPLLVSAAVTNEAIEEAALGPEFDPDAVAGEELPPLPAEPPPDVADLARIYGEALLKQRDAAQLRTYLERELAAAGVAEATALVDVERAHKALLVATAPVDEDGAS